MKTTKRTEKHVGPGKEIVSIYTERELHEAIKHRAKAKRVSLSFYVRELAIQDLAKSGMLPDGFCA